MIGRTFKIWGAKGKLSFLLSSFKVKLRQIDLLGLYWFVKMGTSCPVRHCLHGAKARVLGCTLGVTDSLKKFVQVKRGSRESKEAKCAEKRECTWLAHGQQSEHWLENRKETTQSSWVTFWETSKCYGIEITSQYGCLKQNRWAGSRGTRLCKKIKASTLINLGTSISCNQHSFYISNFVYWKHVHCVIIWDY